MELRQIRSFLVLAEELHFGRAASRLYLAQPALSQQIKQLEEFLGVALFERTSRSVRLTEAGTTFLPRARAAMRELSEAQDQLKGAESGSTGTVRVGFISTAAVRLVPRLVQRMKKAYPRVRLQLKESETAFQVQAILSGTLDIGLVHASQLHPSLRQQVVEDGRLLVALPVRHRLAAARKVTLKDLAQEAMIIPPATAHRDLHDAIRNLFETNKVLLQDPQEVTLLQTALALVAGGTGCALMPDAFVHLKPRGVVFKPLAGAQLALPLYAVTRAESCSKLVRNALEQLDDKPR